MVPQDVVNVVIAEGVKIIPECTFATRKYLVSVELPSSLRSISSFAFVDCDSLDHITIPAGVTEIADGALSFCSNLKSINVDIGNSHYSSYNGTLYSKDKSHLIQYNVAQDSEDIVILPSVLYIHDYAFNDCKNLKTVRFHEGVRTVGNNAFNGCSNLTFVVIPQGMQSIGACAFYNCPLLPSVTLPKSIESIGTYAFGYSDMLKRNSNFYLRGYASTEAERYAAECGLKFIKVFEVVAPASIEWADGSSSHTLSVGDSLELSVNVLPSEEDAELGKDVTDKSVRWSTSDTTVATVANGIVRGVSVGKATITATTSDGKCSTSCTVSTVIPVTAIEIDQPSISVKPGNVVNLSATLEPANTTSRSLVWTSSDPSIAQIIQQDQEEYEDLLMYRCKVVPKLPGTVTIKAASRGNSVSSTCEFTVTDPSPSDAQIIVKGSAGSQSKGSLYSVQLFLRNNPGIVGMNLRVLYDAEYLKLTNSSSVVDSGVLGTAHHSNRYSASPYYLCWANDTRDTNITTSEDVDTLIVTLKFQLVKTVSKVTKFPVSVFYDSDNLDIYNVDSEPVEFSVVNSSVKAADVTYGDVNNDNAVNSEDVARLIKYLSNYATSIAFNPEAADVNSDDRITHRDQVILARHVDASQTYAVESPLVEDVKSNTVVTIDSEVDSKAAITQAAMNNVRITIVKDDKTVTLAKGTDYVLALTQNSSYTITFKKGTNITDTETAASIYYHVWSPWHSAGYDTLPLDN